MSICEQTFTYLQHHYKTLDEISSHLNITQSIILDFIEKSYVPKHSYEIATQHIVISCVAVENFYSTTYYFHPDVIAWANKINELIKSDKDIKQLIYLEFESEFMHALHMPEAKIAYPNYVNKNNEFDSTKIALLVKEKWSEFLSGGYGVCLRHVTATNIVKKDAVVAVLNIILNSNMHHYQINDVTQYLTMYNELCQPFAAYEVNNSSRKKLYDAVSANTILHPTS